MGRYLESSLMKCIFASRDNAWSNNLFKSLVSDTDVTWLRVTNSLNLEEVIDINPDWIFFFHWSNIVSKDVWQRFQCVTIHTSNLPDGRGGSPIQNQIIKGVKSSRVNALQMSRKVDSGPVYCSLPVTLQGSLTDIWMIISEQAKHLIQKCINENPTPTPQDLSTTTITKRRKTSEIPFSDLQNLFKLYDYIRMLDAEDYPKSKFSIGNFLIEFSRASLNDDEILCDAKIRRIK